MAGNVEFGIRITADGKVAVVEAGNVKKAFEEIGKSADAVATKTGKVRDGLDSISNSVKMLTGLNIGTLGFDIAREAVVAFRDSMFNLPSIGREFQASMETNQLGMAGILTSMTQMNGKALDFGRAMSISSDMMGKLNQDAIRTAASTAELVNAYRALLGPGMAANMSLEQIRQLTVTGVNAVKSMGLPAQQVVQELRDLVAGGITAASSTLATALGLRDEDIARAKASAEGLYSFLMKRLSGFTQAAEMYNDTISGVSSAMKEKLTLAAADGFKSLTAASKEAMKDITKIVESKGFLDSLSAISEALVYMGFMAKAAFSIMKEFLLAGALVAGGYAIAGGIAAINASTVLATGSMALLNKEAAMFVFGAALAKLQTLGAAGKGGLLGLALFGGWEIGSFFNMFEPIRKGVAYALEPVFRFFDRSDGAMLDKLGERLAQLKSVMAEASVPNFEKTNPGQIRLAEIANTERQIAEIRKRMGLDAQAQSPGGAAPAKDPSLNVGILEQSYQKLIGTVKTAASIEKEYAEQLSASKLKYIELAAAKAGAGASDKELMALAKQQDDYASGLAKKRAEELRALNKDAIAAQKERERELEKGRKSEEASMAARFDAANTAYIEDGQRKLKVLADERKAFDEMRSAVDAMGVSEAKRLDGEIKAQELHNAEIGKTAEQKQLERKAIDDAAIARFRVEANALRIAAETVDMDQRIKDIYVSRANALDLVIAKEGELSNLRAVGAAREANLADIKRQAEVWGSMWDSVEKAGKDVFTHVFSDGKTAFEGIGKAIKASVIDLLYQITAKKWIVQIGTSLAGSMGLSTTASAAGTGSSLLSGGSMLGNLGAGQTMADFGNFFGSIGSVAESGASFGVMDAISGFAMANPWTAAAAAVLALFSTGALDGIFGGNDRVATPQMAGLGSNSTITRGGFSGQQWTASGSSPTDLWAGSVWEPLPAQYLTGFNNAVKQVFDSMETQAKAAGLSVDSLASLTVNMGATGYGVQKDLETALLATSDAIAERLMPNIRSLQSNGESLAQTFARVTTATIQAKAAEDARLAALATQQRSLEIQLMEAQGDAAGALAAKREDELKALDASLKPLQEQIYAAQDLAKANEDAAKAQQDAAAAAQDVTRAQEEMVASMRDTLSTLVSQGQGVHNFLRGLGATGATGSLDTTRAAYLEDLAGARAGNADAYQRITQSAGDYIKAGQDMWASSSTQIDLVAQIKRELGGLAPVKNLDENIKLLTLIEASTKNTATATGNLDVLGIKAIFDVSQVITFVANSQGIPPELRNLITKQAQDYAVTLKAIDTDPSLTPAMKSVLFAGAGTYTAAARAIISDVAMNADAKRVAFDAAGGYTAAVRAIQSNGVMDAAAKAVAFDQQGQYIAAVLAVVSNAGMNADAKRVALTGLGYYEAQVLATLQDPSKFDATAYSLAVTRQNDYMALVKAQLSGDSTTQNLAAILKGTAGANISVNGSVVFDPNDPIKSVFDIISVTLVNMLSAVVYQSVMQQSQLASIAALLAKPSVYYDVILQGYSANDPNWARAIANTSGSISAEQIAAASAAQTSAAAAVAASKLGHFASGGLASGWAVVGEEGRELVNFSAPGRVYSASDTQAMLGGAANDDLLAELRLLRAQVAALERAASTDVKEQTARITAAVEDSAQSMGRTVARAAEAGARA